MNNTKVGFGKCTESTRIRHEYIMIVTIKSWYRRMNKLYSTVTHTEIVRVPSYRYACMIVYESYYHYVNQPTKRHARFWVSKKYQCSEKVFRITYLNVFRGYQNKFFHCLRDDCYWGTYEIFWVKFCSTKLELCTS